MQVEDWKNSEKNYPAHKLEFLVLKWSVTDRFKDLLYRKKFEVITDSTNLCTFQCQAGCLGWLATLAAHDFIIKYRPGKEIKMRTHYTDY